MYRIAKAKETMTSRERVRRCFALEQTDRVPIDYCANPTVHAAVMQVLGAKNYDDFCNMLGVDFRGVHAKFIGTNRFPEIEGLKVDPVYGSYTRWVPNAYGGYQDFCRFPLMNAGDEVIAAYRFPSPDEFDYEEAISAMACYADYALYVGSAGYPDIINSLGRIMGMEDTLVGLATENEVVLAMLDRKLDMELGILERLLQKANGRIDFMWLGEDLGTQHTPMTSLDLFRRVLRPRHQRFIDLAKAYQLPVLVHSCGSSSWAYEDFIAMGVTGVDTLQPEAAYMSPDYLTQHFGGRLAFHGCISTAGPLATGSAQEVAQYCRETLQVMMPAKGYMFAPSHAIQDNSPVENVIAMYQAAHRYGTY